MNSSAARSALFRHRGGGMRHAAGSPFGASADRSVDKKAGNGLEI
jgi:hypothetical protein